MVSVQEQYEAYPYPDRDPADEAKRLVMGSPSHPFEMDHWLWRGQRDWSQTLRVLVAGGGTGDALIQLAQVMASAGAPYEITYIDLSKTSRAIAEARAEARGLTNITFVTGSLLDAADHGPFDYIDCCGVLHHLPDPTEGFAALRKAVAPGGGMGFMVYAPYGRSGVYPLQEAFAALFEGLDPQVRVYRAKEIVKALPEGHPFRANLNLSDHKVSDAGFYDLLLHGQDTPFDVPKVFEACAASGWRLQSFCVPALYDLSRLASRPSGMDDLTAMTVAEKLRGTMKKHFGYLVPDDEERPLPGGESHLVPRIAIRDMRPLAQMVAKGRVLPLTIAEQKVQLKLPRETAPLVAAIDNRRSLGEIAKVAGMDPLRFNMVWPKVAREFIAHGMMHYSSLGLSR